MLAKYGKNRSRTLAKLGQSRTNQSWPKLVGVGHNRRNCGRSWQTSAKFGRRSPNWGRYRPQASPSRPSLADSGPNFGSQSKCSTALRDSTWPGQLSHPGRPTIHVLKRLPAVSPSGERCRRAEGRLGVDHARPTRRLKGRGVNPPRGRRASTEAGAAGADVREEAAGRPTARPSNLCRPPPTEPSTDRSTARPPADRKTHRLPGRLPALPPPAAQAPPPSRCAARPVDRPAADGEGR